MNWQGKTVGYALTGSHCTFEEVMPQIQGFVDAGAKRHSDCIEYNYDDGHTIWQIGRLATTVEGYYRE